MKNQTNLYLDKKIYKEFKDKCYWKRISVSEMIEYQMENMDLDYQYEEYLKNKINKNKDE